MPAIRVHHTEIDEGPWDAGANVARLESGRDAAYYARVYAWRDPDADETTKSAYKLPHHVVSADGEPGAANVRACQSGIGVLNGARGGAEIPDADRRGVWQHLAAHLEDAEVEAAPLRSGGGTAKAVTTNGDSGVERRAISADEVRVVDGDGGPRIAGYAAVFNQVSEELWGFREVIAPGAFAATLQGDPDVRALWNHDPNYVLGRTRSGTLRVWEDERGLAFEVEPPDTQWARDLLVTMRRGDVSQMSFGFTVERDRWEQDEDGNVLRTVVAVGELYDISPVTFPAYPQTTAHVRARAEEMRGGTAEAVTASGREGVGLRLRRMRLELEEAR